MSIEKVYEWIDKGEESILSKSFEKCIKEYENAKTEITKVLQSLQKDENKLDESLIVVVESLSDEINSRLDKVCKIQETLNNKTKNTSDKTLSLESLSNSSKEYSNSPAKRSTAKILATDVQGDLDHKKFDDNDLISLNDPILDTIINELDSSMNKQIPSTYKHVIKRELNTLKVKMATYDIKLKNDQSLREQLLIEENNDLRQHIEKLTARWENLVESAKQKRRGSIQ